MRLVHYSRKLWRYKGRRLCFGKAYDGYVLRYVQSEGLYCVKGSIGYDVVEGKDCVGPVFAFEQFQSFVSRTFVVDIAVDDNRAVNGDVSFAQSLQVAVLRRLTMSRCVGPPINAMRLLPVSIRWRVA